MTTMTPQSPAAPPPAATSSQGLYPVGRPKGGGTWSMWRQMRQIHFSANASVPSCSTRSSNTPPLVAGKNSRHWPFLGCTSKPRRPNTVLPPAAGPTSLRYSSSVARVCPPRLASSTSAPRLASKCAANRCPAWYRITVGASNVVNALPGNNASVFRTYARSPGEAPSSTQLVLVRMPCSCSSRYLTQAPAAAPATATSAA
mmetsp:Transcript_17675/g.43710  ORF Transcript_17675/g.43710 Transcript_17675/m.43710 type:complete len:201 (-) Transcript_17675:825-1427(-)